MIKIIILWSEPLEFSDLRYMVKNSDIIEVGSHTYTLHSYQTNGQPAIKKMEGETDSEYLDRINKDLRVSKELLELQLEKNIIALSWPFGISTEQAEKIASNNNYRLLFTIDQKTFSPEKELKNIPRFIIQNGCLDEFKSILKSN